MDGSCQPLGSSQGGGIAGSGGGSGGGSSSVGGGTAMTPHERSEWPAPPDAPPASNYALTTDTATDVVTGLMWQRKEPAQTYLWSDAQAYCENLALDGFDDWRMPTLIELESLVNYGDYYPSINVMQFPGSGPEDAYWASSLEGVPEGRAWVVEFFYGNSVTVDTGFPQAVRCVRSTRDSGSDAGSARYNVFGGVVQDQVTGLSWQAAPPPGWYTWGDANDYCATLMLAGSAAWRLPRLKELRSLVVLSAPFRLDATAFPEPPPGDYWSSTVRADNGSIAWLGSFYDGTTYWHTAAPDPSDGDVFRVRCVR
jgi:hypothetical protein